jgi:hypothetical protein
MLFLFGAFGAGSRPCFTRALQCFLTDEDVSENLRKTGAVGKKVRFKNAVYPSRKPEISGFHPGANL